MLTNTMVTPKLLSIETECQQVSSVVLAFTDLHFSTGACGAGGSKHLQGTESQVCVKSVTGYSDSKYFKCGQCKPQSCTAVAETSSSLLGNLWYWERNLRT